MAYTPKLTYKGRPLVRKGNEIYYGSMNDPYIIYMNILNTREDHGITVPDKVQIILMTTDTSKTEMERVVRMANKAGLFNALSFGDIMLQGALAKK